MLIPNAQITTHMWLQLPVSVRLRLKELFNIPRSAGTQVEDNQVISDGYTHADLATLTVKKMQDYLLTDEEDIFVLFDSVVGTILDEEMNPKVPFEKAPETPVVEAPRTEPSVVIVIDGVPFYPEPAVIKKILKAIQPPKVKESTEKKTRPARRNKVK